MTIRSEKNQEFEQEIQALKQELVRVNIHVQKIEQKIAFRQKGQRGRFMTELNKTKKHRDTIASDIKRIEAKATAKGTEIFLKDFEKQELQELEKERVLALFNEYKENPNIFSIPIKIQRDKPNFSEIGDRIIDRNREELEKAQIEYNSAYQKASKRSAVGTGQRTANLTIARKRLNEALFDVSHEPILTEFRELLAESEWLETVIVEREAEIEERQSQIDKIEKDFALFEKHGLIKPKT